MKKIVLYTIGALCLLGQNGVSSDNPDFIGYNKKGTRIESWIHLPKPSEMEEITNQISSLISNKKISELESAELQKLDAQCQEIFAKEHNFLLENVRTGVLLGNKNREEDRGVTRFDDNVFCITGESDKNGISVMVEAIWGPDTPYESKRVRIIPDSPADKKGITNSSSVE